jgi:cation diffusion facilitator CzcD-associated flavoprotein CzcO
MVGDLGDGMSGPTRLVGIAVENRTDVAIIGAGQAGLSSAYALRRAGLSPERDFVIFDRSPKPGGAWQFRWPSLTFATVHGVYQLPGMSLAEQDAKTPVADAVPRYFAEYERTFDLQVRRPVNVRSVSEAPERRLRIETDAGIWSVRALINATGTWDRPFWPRYPGQELFTGRQLHTADYRGANEFAGQRVVVVGGGASAIQLLTEIAEVAAGTVWVTRRPPEFTDRPFDAEWGRAVEARVADRVRRGLLPESVVKATGSALTPEIEAGIASGVLNRLPMFDRITPDGVAWEDGRFEPADAIVWSTGFRAVLDHLAPLRLRRPGGGVAVDQTRSLDDPRIFFVGYGPSASTIGANRAGRVAARGVRDYLAQAEVRPESGYPSTRATTIRETAPTRVDSTTASRASEAARLKRVA